MNIPPVIAWPLLLIPWLVAGVFSASILLMHFPPSGVRVFSMALDGKNPWFDVFLPGERATQAGLQREGWVGQRIVMDPVYAGARPPGAFDRLALTFETRVQAQTLLEFGILRDAQSFTFEMKPLWSQVLEQGWRPVRRGDREGFVREDQEDRVLETATVDQLLVWYASTTPQALSDIPAPRKTTDISLRGSHDFHIVPVNGEINMTLAIQDMNRSRGKNAIAFRLTRGEELVWTDAVSVSGAQDARPNRVVEKEVQVTGLVPGVYKLSFMADDDVFLRRITTTAKRWVIGPRLYFADNVGYSTSTPSVAMWTNSRHLVAETFHKEGLQTIRFGSLVSVISKTHETYEVSRAPAELAGDRLLVAPKGDIRVIGDGYAAFTKEALFLPYPRRLTHASDPLREGVLAIVTPYQRPQRTADGWWIVKTAFALPSSLATPKFTLGASGLLARNGAVDIRHVELRYERQALSWDAWWVYVRRELAAAWKKI
ncbi:MAG: hypothetical protein WCV84_00755 [Patescibacteria group bacterium]